MLNERSDRVPPAPRKPLLTSLRFWSGVATVLVSLTLLIGVFARFAG